MQLFSLHRFRQLWPMFQVYPTGYVFHPLNHRKDEMGNEIKYSHPVLSVNVIYLYLPPAYSQQLRFPVWCLGWLRGLLNMRHISSCLMQHMLLPTWGKNTLHSACKESLHPLTYFNIMSIFYNNMGEF
jgi:hypothetical protein